MYIPDLTESGSLRLVGYLSREHDYPKGKTSDAVFDRLAEMVLLRLVSWGGYHYCELELRGLNQAQPELYWRGMVIPRRCSSDILVPAVMVVYQAPALILHYIRAHQYLPPTCFLDAALKCPNARSQEYHRAIEDLGPLWKLL
jgi:hypothetical protein